MLCPKCEPTCAVDMERDDKTSDVSSITGRPPSWGAEYFCPRCYRSWYYNKAIGLQPMGRSYGNGDESICDEISEYAAGYVDENGQVW
jgi:hypothetical protein